MPTLHWIGKEKVTNHHLDIPYHTLDLQYNFGLNQDSGDVKDAKDSDNPSNPIIKQGSDNLIIHADNLLALKSLLPQYEGRIKCIYIDPPYNTGNEGWVYNDNVSSPRFKKWLGQVVGKEGEDLTRHDKWLCMMYPRLKLLHKLLAEDGAIFISIDDNEQASLKMVMDEIFGANQLIETLIWKKRATAPNDRIIGKNHEYILAYSKNKSRVRIHLQPRTNELNKRYTNPDNDSRGPWVASDLSANGKGGRMVESLVYGIFNPNNKKEYYPPKNKCWLYNKEKIEEYLAENRIGFRESTGTPFLKRYLTEVRVGMTLPTIIDDGGFSQDSAIEQKKIFGDGIFEFPKPSKLIEKILQTGMQSGDIVLDSFAGSGTTAHAVLNLNKLDGGKRKFILIEMEDYAESITAERVKRVINGYGKHTSEEGNNGTGGSFSFYTLGERVLDDEQNLNPNLALHKIYGYIWYSETHTAYTQQATAAGYLGKYSSTGIYFHYQPQQVTVLDDAYLTNVTELCEQYIMYADVCLLPETLMHKHNIIFKKIPRDISKL